MARIVLAPPVRPLPIVRGSGPPLTLATIDAERDAADQVGGGHDQDGAQDVEGFHGCGV